MANDNTTERPVLQPQDFSFGEGEENALALDCGKKLYGVNLRYETCGTLNAARSNAILIEHALTGDAHVCGCHHPNDRKSGWWSTMVGPGKAIDTNRYFVVCSNVLGGCSGSTGPRSNDPATGKPYNLTFPVITIRDMVRAQKRLMEHLGISQWLSVIGGSMGGMQVLEWAVSYPECVKCAIPIATTSQLSPQSIAFDWVAREAITSDPNWNNGNYTDDCAPDRGLATARMLAHITYLSDESMRRKFGRDLQESNAYRFGFQRDFAVESYLEHQGQRFIERFDAVCYCYITRATDYFDLADRAGGDLAAALSPAKAAFLVLSFSSDWLFPTEQAKKLVKALLQNNRDVSFCELQSAYGHDAFLMEHPLMERMVSAFLQKQQEAQHD